MKKKNKNQGSLAGVFSDVKRAIEIDVEKIFKNPKQPRFEAHNCEIEELANSIQTHGMLQPISVCENDDQTYTLICGERRLLAVKFLKHSKIQAFVFASQLKDDNLGVLALVENLERKKLHPIEIGFAFDELLGGKAFGSQAELARAFGYSDGVISKYLSAVKLSKFIIDAIKISGYKDLEVISALNSLEPDDAMRAFNVIAGDELSRQEALDVIKKLKSDNTSKATACSFKNRGGVYRFRVDENALSDEKKEILRQKIAQIRELFEE